MKFLHTSDWHLGQKFLSNDREEEHRRALLRIVEWVESEKADALIIAGDVFDIGNPPHYARRLYYDFLTRMLKSSCCRHIVITGGNHDSPSMLNAPRDLLRALRVHVIGAATGNIEDEIVELRDDQDRLEAVVAAVPFLRDGDIRASVSGETAADRVEQIKTAILQHYQQVGEYCERYRGQNIPIIATGHLYAAGASASEKQDNIYIGNTDNIDARHFPGIFAYVALGHLHRLQSVGGLLHVWYSGSPIPLSFSETKDDKAALSVSFEGDKLLEVKPLPLPVFRRLKTIEGSLEKVEADLLKFGSKPDRDLSSWVDIIVHAEQFIPQLDTRLHELAQGMDLEILKIRLHRPAATTDALSTAFDLDSLAPEEVFEQRCRAFAMNDEELNELKTTFAELRSWMQQQEVLP